MVDKKLLNYMYNLERFGIKPGLKTISKLMNLLGNPEKKLKAIHVAGTNGKGSTSSMIATILQESNYKVGLYTSPHLIRFNERITINKQEIKDDELTKLILKIKELIEKNKLNPTFFEFTTALAFIYFANKKVDYAVIEVGMGGLLDATNIINPIISVITNIDFDHMKYLGNTLKKIASNKIGIIKKDVPLVTSERNDLIKEQIREKCLKENALYYNINDYKITIIQSNINQQIFSFEKTIYKLNMLGEYQIYNACLAIKVCLLIGLSTPIIKKGLEKSFWSGRMEIVNKKPFIMLECAHNIAGIRNLKQFLNRNFHEIYLILGISNDEHKLSMIKELLPFAKKVIISKAHYKGMNPKKIAPLIKTNYQIIPDVKIAIKKAMNEHLDIPIIVTGSIYLVGEAKELFS